MVTEIERKRGRGRPPGSKRFDDKKVFYLDQRRAAILKRLADRHGESESAIIRKLLDEQSRVVMSDDGQE